MCHFGPDSNLDWDTLARTLWTETFWTDTFWTVTFWTRTLWIETLWIKALLKTHFGLTHFGLSYSEIHFNVKINEENIYIHTIMFISVVKKVLHRTMLSIMAKLNTYDFFHSFQLFLMTLLTVDHGWCHTSKLKLTTCTEYCMTPFVLFRLIHLVESTE